MSVDELLERLGEVVELVSRASSETERCLAFVAWLNAWLEGKGLGRIIVVGGFAAEVYTAGVYRTGDIDIVVEGSRAEGIVREFLKRVSERGLRVFIPRIVELGKAVDIVSARYLGRKPPMRLVYRGLGVYIEAPEELVVKYLAGWKFWSSSEDRDKALALLAALWSKLDREYLFERAREEGVHDKLVEALAILGLGGVEEG